MQIPMSMILLCKILARKANYWTNIIAGSIKTAVMISTLSISSVTQYYYFFAVIEIATIICIIVYAIQWLREKVLPAFVVEVKRVQVL